MAITVISSNIVNIFGIQGISFEFLNSDGFPKLEPEVLYLKEFSEQATIKFIERDAKKKEIRIWNKTLDKVEENPQIDYGELTIQLCGFMPEMLPRFFGGDYDAVSKTYTPPMKTEQDNREYFSVTVYATDIIDNGRLRQYEGHSFSYCKVENKLPILSFVDGDFTKPELIIRFDDNVAQMKPLWIYNLMQALPWGTTIPEYSNPYTHDLKMLIDAMANLGLEVPVNADITTITEMINSIVAVARRIALKDVCKRVLYTPASKNISDSANVWVIDVSTFSVSDNVPRSLCMVIPKKTILETVTIKLS